MITSTTRHKTKKASVLNYIKTAPILEPEEEFDIRINFKEESYTFEKGTYQSSLLNGIISEEDYNATVSHCSNLLGKSMIDKKNNDSLVFPGILKILSLVAICLLIIFFSTLSPALTDHGNREALFAISVIIVVIMIIITFCMSIYNYNYDIKSFKNLSYFAVKYINEFLEKENAKYGKRLRFVLNDCGSEYNRFLYVVVGKE
mmetsp:Transcript_24304/g.25377  ORF Transcript_24304/g.25377 Transcript_24304/m.25377 type:complete len:203 (-) Transcript_24304:95-703(-)